MNNAIEALNRIIESIKTYSLPEIEGMLNNNKTSLNKITKDNERLLKDLKKYTDTIKECQEAIKILSASWKS